ncbi:MAG: LacI family DNA-binding transcriptional regulator, partial [Pygmaiobacter massiliensis]
MLPNRKYSIAEIAQICNVSKSTVSRVINNNPNGVGEETRQKVLATIQEMGYRPNALARSVATSRSNTIGVIIPDVSNFFYPKIIKGITDYMDTKDYAVIVCNS